MNWAKARKTPPPERHYAWPEKTPAQKALKQAKGHKRRTQRGPNPTGRPHGPEIWITVGADCPWNTTPGVRQVHCFHSIEEAETAGFTGVK